MRLFVRPLFLFKLLLVVSFLDVIPGWAWSNDKQNPPLPAKPTTASSPTQNQASLVQAPADDEALFNAGKFQEVIEHLGAKVGELDAKNLKILGRAQSAVKNSAAAIKTFNQALIKDPKDAEASTLIGLELMSTGKDREAMLSFREAVKINNKFEPAYLGIEKIYIKKNNKYELRMLYSDMIEIIGEKPQYLTRLCEIYYSNGLYDDAKATCQRSIQLKKDEPKSYIFLALSLKEKGEKDQASKLLKKTAEDFNSSEDAQLAYAQYLEAEKNLIEAIKFYKAASEINPNSLKSAISLGLAYVELQKYQDSYDALDKACKLDRRSIKEVRRVLGILRVTKEEKWFEKFSALAENCGLPSYESKSTN